MESARYVRIKISPRRLKNPDLDIRYVLTDLVIDKSDGLVEDGGYDYLDDEAETMAIYLETAQPDFAVKKILELIETNEILGNNLKESIEIEVEQEINSHRFESVYRPF